MLAWVPGFLRMIYSYYCLQLGSSGLIFLSDHFWLDSSIFPCVILRGNYHYILHLLDQALSFNVSRWPNCCSFLSCKDSVKLFNFSLILSFSMGALSSNLTLQFHLIILASTLSILKRSCLPAKYCFLLTEHYIYMLSL